VTEWGEFTNVDWLHVREVVALPIIIDGRNCLDPEALRSIGFEYYGIGRSIAKLLSHKSRERP